MMLDTLKSIYDLATKIGNTELNAKLFALQKESFEILEQNRILKVENAELKKIKDLEEQIERHEDYYITLKDDVNKIKYCAVCWGVDEKLVPLYMEHVKPQCAVCISEKRIVKHPMKMSTPISVPRNIRRG